METWGSAATAQVKDSQSPSKDVNKQSRKALGSWGRPWEDWSMSLAALRDAPHVASVFSGSCNSCLCPIN